MEVDMSPEAVTQRLRLMDELWELSIKLMNSKRVESPINKGDEREPAYEKTTDQDHSQPHS